MKGRERRVLCSGLGATKVVGRTKDKIRAVEAAPPPGYECFGSFQEPRQLTGEGARLIKLVQRRAYGFRDIWFFALEIIALCHKMRNALAK